MYVYTWWWSTTTETCSVQCNKENDLLIYTSTIQSLITGLYNRIKALCDGIETLNFLTMSMLCISEWEDTCERWNGTEGARSIPPSYHLLKELTWTAKTCHVRTRIERETNQFEAKWISTQPRLSINGNFNITLKWNWHIFCNPRKPLPIWKYYCDARHFSTNHRNCNRNVFNFWRCVKKI
jgi:hypothetical protein